MRNKNQTGSKEAKKEPSLKPEGGRQIKAKNVHAENRIVFVEDKGVQMYGVTRPLEETGQWHVIKCRSSDETLKTLEAASQKNELPSIVSIDLGLDDLPETTDRGLELLEKIRKRWQGLPIIAHSTLETNESIVRRVVAQGASYFYLRDISDVEGYIGILPFIAIGFLIYSPKPAAQLPRIASKIPDPFYTHPEYWRTLELLDKDFTYAQIANMDSKAKTEKGIMSRVRRIAMWLAELGEIEEIYLDADNLPNEGYRRVVVRWYRANKARSTP